MLFKHLTRHLLNSNSFKLLTNVNVTSNAVKTVRFLSLTRLNFDKSNLKYTDKHEWIRVEGNRGTIGITDYAQDKLGEVVYVELPEVGAKFEQAGQFATLESVKAVSECYLPVAGSVVQVNESLKENPSQINKSSFNDGWLVKIDIANQADLDKLMNESQYNEFLKSESDH